MEIYSQLRDARRKLGLSQGDLAKRLGMTQAHVSDIEKGKVAPRLTSAIDIARALDLELIIVPRSKLPMIDAILSGQADAPLWQIDDPASADES